MNFSGIELSPEDTSFVFRTAAALAIEPQEVFRIAVSSRQTKLEGGHFISLDLAGEWNAQVTR